MKTSTKLLLIFFLSIPVSLLAYNALLKQQLNAGNLVMSLRPDATQQFTEIKLPKFKHLVVNGSLTYGSQNFVNTDWKPSISINQSTGNTISILNGYGDIIKHRIANDTLYITFHKNAIYDEASYMYYAADVVKIGTDDLHSVNASYGRFNLTGNLQTNNNLKVNVDGKSTVSFADFLADRLDLTLKDSSEVTALQNKINNFYYNLPRKGWLTVDVYSANHFHPGNVDSLSWIIIRGKSSQTKQLLKP